MLARGDQFAIRPRSVPVEDIIQATEPALRLLPKTAADDICLEVSQAIAQHKLVQPNLSGQEWRALQDLCQDRSIHILTADKVVMDRKDYDRKVRNILESGAYRPLPKDPTQSIREENEAKVLALQCAGNIPYNLYRQLRSSCLRPTHKINKPDVPLRPIVATRRERPFLQYCQAPCKHLASASWQTLIIV